MKKLFISISVLMLLIVLLNSCSKEDIDFSEDSGTFVDQRDGHKYKWIKIGDQIWMAENLAYLPMVNLPDEKSNTESRYYVYGHNNTSTSEAKESTNYATYGVLYNYAATSEAVPDGWRLPTYDDVISLCSYINDEQGPYSRDEYRWEGIGKHLKSNYGWDMECNGSDDYGFTALGGGTIYWEGTDFSGLESYHYLTEFGNWWTSTIADSSDDSEYWTFGVWAGEDGIEINKIYINDYDRMSGVSIRCIKK